MKITNEEFVKLFMNSNTNREVGDKAGLSAQAVLSRARYLRARGVNLPSKTGWRKVDVDGLNDLIVGIKAGTVGMGEVKSKPMPQVRHAEAPAPEAPEEDDPNSVDNARAEGR